MVTTTCARLPGRKGTLVSEVDGSFESLLEHIRESRGFDFTGYKRESLTRRVRRRMQDIGVTSFEGYSDHLQVHPEEFKHLFDTVLINLTGFFRDPEAWQYLQEQIIPEIVEQRPNGPIRIWSAGCAGGQEAYTLAICFAEALGVDDLRQRVKIYATDVDDHALAQARAATYSRAQVAACPRSGWRAGSSRSPRGTRSSSASCCGGR